MSAIFVQLLEAVMLVCFGVSWPIDILNTLRMRRAEGKSLLFMAMIIVGYAAGLGSKFVRSSATGSAFEPVCWLYIANIVLVVADLAISCYYQRKEVALD